MLVTNLSRLMEAALAGEEVVIARGDKPVVRLIAVAESSPTHCPRPLPISLNLDIYAWA
jgi:antitoxin (DNA-binding transcriptional repressor) of toxin-antitoxin stability system